MITIIKFGLFSTSLKKNELRYDFFSRSYGSIRVTYCVFVLNDIYIMIIYIILLGMGISFNRFPIDGINSIACIFSNLSIHGFERCVCELSNAV